MASGTDAGTYTVAAPQVINNGTYTNHLGPVVTTGTDAGTMMTWLLPPGRTGLLDTYVLGQQVGDAGPNFGFAKWECGVGIFGRCQYSMPCMATQAWLASDAGVATGWSTAVSLTAIDGGGCAESVLVRSPGHTALWGGLSQFATVPSWPTNGAVPPVPGYDLWLDGTFSGNTATTWYDRSGNGYNATATSHGGGSMQLLPTDCYGRQCYRFSSTGGNGDQPYMVTAASWPLGSFTLFLVFRLTNPSASLNRPGGFATATDCTNLSVEPIYDNVTNAWPTGYVNHTSYGQPGSPLNNNMHIAAIAKAGDTYYDPWLDGVWVGTRSTGAPPSTTDSRTIGYTSNCGTEVMYGDMAEVIEYPFDLTLQQYKTVDEYLGVKWGVTVP
jgi:hypothetical protein